MTDPRRTTPTGKTRARALGIPFDGTPGPNYEWHDETIAWFEHWLKGVQNGVEREVDGKRRLAVFVRSGHSPDVNLTETPGRWWRLRWPIAKTSWRKLFPCSGRRLLKRTAGSTAVDVLTYASGSGTAAGVWWGDVTGDMSEDDAKSLAYDSCPLRMALVIIGRPSVKLKVSASVPRANWSCRLEDVAPDGKVSLVTGALLNGCHTSSRTEPSDLVPDKVYELEFDLHFTSWTFKPGHRIRLSVSNSQFPMAWPTPYPLTTRLHVGCRQTALALPVVSLPRSKAPVFAGLKKKDECPDGSCGESTGKRFVRRDVEKETTTYIRQTVSSYDIRRRSYVVKERNEWTTRQREPWKSCYCGRMTSTIRSPRRTIRLRTTMQVRSTRRRFHVCVCRDLFLNGKRIRRRTWRESIPRHCQ